MDSETDPSGDFLKGTIYLHRGQYRRAMRCFKTLLEVERKTGNPDRVVPVLINLGNTHAALGQNKAARTAYREVLQFQKESPDYRVVGEVLACLGNLCRDQGETGRARAYYLEAEEMLESVNGETSLGVLLSDHGLLEREANNPEKAIVLFKRAIDLHKKCGHEDGLAVTWGRLGQAFLNTGELKKAETCLNHSHTHFGQLGDPGGQVQALRALAQVYEQREDPELAYLCNKRIREIHQQYGIRKTGDDTPKEKPTGRRRMRKSHPPDATTEK